MACAYQDRCHEDLGTIKQRNGCSGRRAFQTNENIPLSQRIGALGGFKEEALFWLILILFLRKLHMWGRMEWQSFIRDSHADSIAGRVENNLKKEKTGPKNIFDTWTGVFSKNAPKSSKNQSNCEYRIVSTTKLCRIMIFRKKKLSDYIKTFLSRQRSPPQKLVQASMQLKER